MPDERRQWRCRFTEDSTGSTECAEDGGYPCWIEPADGPRIAIWRSDACLARTFEEALKCAEDTVSQMGAWRKT